MNVVAFIPQKRGRKPSLMCERLRVLAAGPIGISLEFSRDPEGLPRLASARLSAQAHMAAGPGWYSVNYTERGNRITKVAEPKDPPRHFQRQGLGGANNALQLAR